MNCGALQEELLESELFGHEQGAFSGAVRRKPGLFEAACGGTLFLDELGEMSPAMQVKLLRALQERVIRRVGGTRDIEVDVRVLAATNRNLRLEVSRGNFREDLYYRLAVITLRMPALAERREDIPLLAHFFLETGARRAGLPVPELSPQALRVLEGYLFPGTVRELCNLSDGQRITPAHLPEELGGELLPAAGAGPEAGERPESLEENEKRHILRVLDYADGNRTRAARILGINRVSLWRKLSRYGL